MGARGAPAGQPRRLSEPTLRAKAFSESCKRSSVQGEANGASMAGQQLPASALRQAPSTPAWLLRPGVARCPKPWPALSRFGNPLHTGASTDLEDSESASLDSQKGVQKPLPKYDGRACAAAASGCEEAAQQKTTGHQSTEGLRLDEVEVVAERASWQEELVACSKSWHSELQEVARAHWGQLADLAAQQQELQREVKRGRLRAHDLEEAEAEQQKNALLCKEGLCEELQVARLEAQQAAASECR